MLKNKTFFCICSISGVNIIIAYCSFLTDVSGFVHSVKYEDPQALGGLASALDIRQQNTVGVSTMRHFIK